MRLHLLLAMAVSLGAAACAAPRAAVRVGVFEVDASPPVGSPLAYDPTKGVQTPLSCRGVVIFGDGGPVVLCAVDWIGIANEGSTQFREALAKAAGTGPDRVAVHTLHQHDAPACDLSAERLLKANGLGGRFFDEPFLRDVMKRAAEAVARAVREARPATRVGLGTARVEKVASNRRILGEDGKVRATRWTACRDPELRALPAGVIDPVLRMVSFWEGEKPIVALTYYATHPQSYYRTGMANPDFPGLARNMRQKTTGVPHVHFNGAGGNIGAGKWNDGAKENRAVLAGRVAAGMEAAWKATKTRPLEAADVGWEVRAVPLPPGAHLVEKELEAALADGNAKPEERKGAARNLGWLRRCRAGEKVTIGCLHLPGTRILHMPGELFVEYQLAAQKMRSDLFVVMAAYGDYGPGYIGTEVAYGQGGYETSERASRVAPSVEKILLEAVRVLLK